MSFMGKKKIAKVAIMKFTAAEANGQTEKNLKDDCIGPDGEKIDMSFDSATAGYEIQERGFSTIAQPFRVSLHKGQVTDEDDGVYWTSDPMGLGGSSNNANIKGKHRIVEDDVSIDITSGYGKVNMYIASEGGSARTLEIRVWTYYA